VSAQRRAGTRSKNNHADTNEQISRSAQAALAASNNRSRWLE